LSRAIITDDGVAIVLAIPEHTTAKVLGICLQLAAVEIPTGVIAEVIEALRVKLARLSQVGLVLLQRSGGRNQNSGEASKVVTFERSLTS
jgi:hypothetical protein